MGATTFTTVSTERDLGTAFRAAVEAAQYEYGHGGYTGTIAEKHGVTVVDYGPLSPADAEAKAYALIDADDPRISDKWGNAGAIGVSFPTREVRFTGLTIEGTDEESLIAAAKAEAYKKRTCRRGEKIVSAYLRDYEVPKAGRAAYREAGVRKVTNATLVVTIKKAKSATPEQDGWLFFGWASE